MKTSRYKSDEQTSILIALITHDGVLGRVHSHFSNKFARPFANKWANLVAGWCFKHFSKYGKAPRKHIESIFTAWAQSSKDTASVELVEAFLSSLSRKYAAHARTINEDYVVDQAAHLFTKVRLEQTMEEVQAQLESNNVQEAAKAFEGYEKIDFASNNWAGFDRDKVKEALRKRDQEEQLIQFPGALKTFLSPYFKRDAFIAFAGPDKRGKSWWLQEVVWQALRQRRRVLYYVLGDMSQNEVYQRLCSRMTRRPINPQVLMIPESLRVKSRDDVQVGREPKKTKAMTLENVEAARKEFLASTASKEMRIRIRCEGGSVVSASDVEQDVKNFARGEFIPDVIVIDYADLLRTEPSTKDLDFRHQSNATWMILRRIAMTTHCLVVVATQTAATAYNSWLIRKKDFSEDKRKNAHVTGMIGINQSDHEKELGVYRLNWIVLRGGKWAETNCVWTAGELGIGNPAICSAFLSKKDRDEEE